MQSESLKLPAGPRKWAHSVRFEAVTDRRRCKIEKSLASLERAR